ncbi:tRNA (cytidine(34)-2'-O)-methyltransferase [Oceanibacterium hippocampi]|uniref:tRNA (cytidine(34)-2'-O)-methyltransferase n=1 Tax=Oceanibacterium hippocampi TaxID=745714 RepID=A0A1Y5TWE6_9PROT|nr:tRNA (cytidine(34)-2'-O)-methyltransferase [Oceanibacterium hippocampi]SLN74642.1 tRNA (cytidine(34)-2'-O)-methyltransferase [Oceanibacterium hippocampi]
MRLALFEPDIPQNVGAAIRLAACLGVALDIVGPCGFPLGDRDLRRVAMDYGALADVTRHVSWASFTATRAEGRLVVLSTGAETAYTEFRFAASDILLMGRESAGLPAPVQAGADARLTIPMAPGARSLNVVVAAAMVLGEALRQDRARNG